MATIPKGYSTQRLNSDEVLVTYFLLKFLLHLSFLSQQACDGTCIHLHVYRELYPSMAHTRLGCICLLVTLSVNIKITQAVITYLNVVEAALFIFLKSYLLS